MPKLAICTVNLNGKKDTLEFLESLTKLDTKNLEVKVFVTDGGSTDGSVNMLKNLVPSPLGPQTQPRTAISLEIILKSENRGSAGGYNDGAKEAMKWGADFVLLINNDTLIRDKNLLKDLIKTINSDPSIGLVSPKILFAPGFEYQKGYNKTDKGNVIWYAGGHFDWKNIRAVHRGIDMIDSNKFDRVEETGLASGTCMLVKRKIFEQGIFWDEGMLAYYDDNDFEERVKQAGYKLYYDGLTSLYHKVSRTSGIGSEISDYYLSRNRLIFGFKYASLRTKFALFREALRLLRSGRPMQKKGVIDFFVGKSGALKK